MVTSDPHVFSQDVGIRPHNSLFFLFEGHKSLDNFWSRVGNFLIPVGVAVKLHQAVPSLIYLSGWVFTPLPGEQISAEHNYLAEAAVALQTAGRASILSNPPPRFHV